MLGPLGGAYLVLNPMLKKLEFDIERSDCVIIVHEYKGRKKLDGVSGLPNSLATCTVSWGRLYGCLSRMAGDKSYAKKA